MNAPLPLHFGSSDVRMILVDDEPWWVLADVGRALDLANPSRLSERLEDYQTKGMPIKHTLGGEQTMIVVNEAGIYQLTMGSRKLAAKAFARWLFTEVIPSIRKHGFYDPARLAALSAQEAQPIPHTRALRLKQEIAAFETRTGHDFLQALGKSKAWLRGLELNQDNIMQALQRGNMWLLLMNLGLDLFYIVNGKRGPALARLTDNLSPRLN